MDVLHDRKWRKVLARQASRRAFANEVGSIFARFDAYTQALPYVGATLKVVLPATKYMAMKIVVPATKYVANKTISGLKALKGSRQEKTRSRQDRLTHLRKSIQSRQQNLGRHKQRSIKGHVGHLSGADGSLPASTAGIFGASRAELKAPAVDARGLQTPGQKDAHKLWLDGYLGPSGGTGVGPDAVSGSGAPMCSTVLAQEQNESKGEHAQAHALGGSKTNGKHAFTAFYHKKNTPTTVTSRQSTHRLQPTCACPEHWIDCLLSDTAPLGPGACVQA